MATHNPIPVHLGEQAAKRFWFKVDKIAPAECWVWQGEQSHNGYGRFRFMWKRYPAHRVAYFLHYGVDPADKLVCHKCDNPPCCNPAHLFLGTSADNNGDMKEKGRAASGDRNPSRLYPQKYIKNRPRGERCGSSRLTDEQVIEIRRLYDSKSHGSYKNLAQQFNVSVHAVFAITHRETWTHLP